jgi:hypothetical protein
MPKKKSGTKSGKEGSQIKSEMLRRIAKEVAAQENIEATTSNKSFKLLSHYVKAMPLRYIKASPPSYLDPPLAISFAVVSRKAFPSGRLKNVAPNRFVACTLSKSIWTVLAKPLGMLLYATSPLGRPSRGPGGARPSTACSKP